MPITPSARMTNATAPRSEADREQVLLDEAPLVPGAVDDVQPFDQGLDALGRAPPHREQDAGRRREPEAAAGALRQRLHLAAQDLRRLIGQETARAFDLTGDALGVEQQAPDPDQRRQRREQGQQGVERRPGGDQGRMILASGGEGPPGDGGPAPWRRVGRRAASVGGGGRTGHGGPPTGIGPG